MDHHIVSHIDTHMTRSWCIISSLEENQVTRLCLGWRYTGTISHQSICRLSSNIPAIAAVIDYPAHKTRTVKTGGWGCAAPYIGIAQVFLCFPNHICKFLIRQGLCRNLITKLAASRKCCGIKQIITVPISTVIEVVASFLILIHPLP